MKRKTLNYVIDLTTAAVMLGLLLTGLLVRFVLPPGSGSGRSLWGLGRHAWGDVHFWLAAAMGAVVLVHLALHWQWVCVTTARFFARGGWPTDLRPMVRNLAGAILVVTLSVALGGFVLVARGQVRTTATALGTSDHIEPHANEQSNAGVAESVRGSMTLADVARSHGVTTEELKARLGLPAEVADDQRLGRLARERGLSMDDVRRVVGDLKERD